MRKTYERGSGGCIGGGAYIVPAPLPILGIGCLFLATGLVVDVGALAVAVEDHDELCRAVDSSEGVRRHGGELAGLAALDSDLAFAERQAHPSFDHEEPVVTGVDPLLRRRAGRFEPHLDGDRVAGRPAQHPGCPFARAVWHRADDHIVVAAHVEERVEVDLEGSCQRQQDVETDRPLASLDPANGRRTEVGAGGKLVERQTERVPKTPQTGPNHVFYLVRISHGSSLSLANMASTPALFGIHRIVVAMSDPAPRPVERQCDVAVIGGSAAGLAAALQLGRQRRSVIVVDAGEPRNSRAAHMHSYLGYEGLPPSQLTTIGSEEVRSYGGEVLAGRVTRVTRTGDGPFRVELVGGHSIVARRALAAIGLVDELPDIDGLAEHWGRDVIHCPFCHGFEVRDRRIVQIVTHRMGLHTAGLFRQLSSHLTVVLHDPVDVDGSELDALAVSGVDVRHGQVSRIVTGADGHVVAVELSDHERIETDAVVVGPRFRVRAEPFAALGLAPAAHPSGLGDFLEADATGATAVPGLYAAGNVTDPSEQVLQAAANGSRVGAMISFSLADEDIRAGARPSANEADWDHRYGGDLMWSGNPNGTLVTETSGLVPGRALDVGAGEGGDALWLAKQGWSVTASDISQRALDRVSAEAERRGLRVECHHVDANSLDAYETAAFDLASAQYASIHRTPDGRAVRNVLNAVAPGGTLLVVGHDLEPMRAPVDALAHSRPFDPDAYVRVDDFAAALAGSPAWDIEVHEKRPRPPGAASASHHIDDVVLRARRRAR